MMTGSCCSLKHILLILPLFLTISCASGPGMLAESVNGPLIRVAVLKGQEAVNISGKDLTIELNGKRSGKRAKSIYINMRGGEMMLEGYGSPLEQVTVSGHRVELAGAPYRGSLSVVVEKGRLTVINRVGLEEYLLGLINHEISSKWPLHAVKAQAVAARTYAYFKLSLNREKLYHIESTVTDQVYGGSGTEDDRGRKAVRDTEGEMLYYKGELARTFYHSCCGGVTESAGTMWGRDYPYLRPVKDDFCTDSPNYFWTFNSSFEAILAAMNGNGYPAMGREEISIVERSESGRVLTLNVAGARLSGTKFREIMGYGNIKSTLFHVETSGDGVIFSGSGSGHGVGMCQWGAKGMAEAGRSYLQILEHYYPGTELKKIY